MNGIMTLGIKEISQTGVSNFSLTNISGALFVSFLPPAFAEITWHRNTVETGIHHQTT